MENSRHDAQNLATYKRMLNEELERLWIESGAITGRKDGLTLAVRGLTSVLQHYVTTEYHRVSYNTVTEDMHHFDSVITGVCDAIEFVVRISQQRDVLDLVRGEIKELEKKLSHD